MPQRRERSPPDLPGPVLTSPSRDHLSFWEKMVRPAAISFFLFFPIWPTTWPFSASFVFPLLWKALRFAPKSVMPHSALVPVHILFWPENQRAQYKERDPPAFLFPQKTDDIHRSFPAQIAAILHIPASSVSHL